MVEFLLEVHLIISFLLKVFFFFSYLSKFIDLLEDSRGVVIPFDAFTLDRFVFFCSGVRWRIFELIYCLSSFCLVCLTLKTMLDASALAFSSFRTRVSVYVCILYYTCMCLCV